METKDFIEKLSGLIDELKGEDGWTNLSAIAPVLRKEGIEFRDFGYEKLIEAIKDNRNVFNWRYESANGAWPQAFVRNKSRGEISRYQRLLANKNRGEIDFSRSPGNALTIWASLGKFPETIGLLEGLSLPERWYYKKVNPKNPFPILVNYLKYTFYRLTQEGGKIIEKENYAAFNTGLVDKRYEPIYALFTKTSAPLSPRNWKFLAFCIAGEEREGKELVRNFNPLPPRAHYFDSVRDMLYDTQTSSPECDWNHIIVENVMRLPQEFIEDNAPSNFQLENTLTMSYDEKIQYFEKLGKEIEKDKKAYRNMNNRLRDALTLALKRIEWNFKTAIPMYFPTKNKMSLLLPLALVDDEKVDVALVVEKTMSGNYLGHTILPLEWAYSNARLVCRPDSDWLVAENIENDETDDSLEE